MLPREQESYLSLPELERALHGLKAPSDRGWLRLIVARTGEGLRETPERALLTPEGGVPNDAWARGSAARDAQLAVMRADVAELVANGQPLDRFGDNLLLDLDLSTGNLPAGSRLRLGPALLEVTAKPHTGCLKFRRRFGPDALRFTADPRFSELRLRGIYMTVIERGEVAVGDPVEVLRRGV